MSDMGKLRYWFMAGLVVGLTSLMFGQPILAAQAQAEVSALAVKAWDAQVVTAPVVASAKAGTTVQFSVVLKNTGTETWNNTGANQVKLGTVKPQDHASRFYTASWMSPNRVTTMQEAQVAPGATGTFVFMAVAGGGSGVISETLAPVAEGITWFGPDIKFTINVTPANFKANLTSATPTAITLKARETATVTVTVQNTGDAAWDNTGATMVAIGTATPNDRKSQLASSSWLASNRPATLQAPVPAGGQGQFSFTIQAPDKIGTIKEDFGVVVEQIAWLPIKFTLVVTVVPAVWDGTWVSQTPANPVPLSPGDTAQLSVQIKNTGNTIWHADGDNAVKLGTARALDRTSGFYSSSWPSNNRVALVSPAVVNPGEVGTFNFTVTAPDKIGKYREYFRPVVEQVKWLTDQGIYFDISVDEEIALTQPIRMGVASTADPITVSGDSFVIRRGSDKSLVKRVTGSITATAISGGYSLSTGETVMDYLRFVPTNGTILTVQTAGISSSYNRFRGIIETRRSALSGNVWVVDTLELEDYLKGVAEVPNSWPLEAQKAQMVAARTYAAAKLTAPVADIFDIYSDTRDLVEDGYNYEIAHSNLVAAAVATSGLVAKYNGVPIKAFFYSDSGGYTADNEDVWGGSPLPYLRAVPDPYANNTPWTTTLTQSYLKGRFDDAIGVAADSSDAIVGMAVTATDVSGRAKTVTFTMQSGKSIPVTGATFDYLVPNTQAKSMIFTIAMTGDSASPDFVLTGKGNGHGVGMPQYGAKGMADAGKTFQDILTYYYTGVQIQPL